MITHRNVSKYLGQHIHCHTHYGTFQGVIIHLSKHHIILGRVPNRVESPGFYPTSFEAERQMMPPGPGGQPTPPGGGGGWQMAIPLAAILGITAVGMHWW